MAPTGEDSRKIGLKPLTQAQKEELMGTADEASTPESMPAQEGSSSTIGLRPLTGAEKKELTPSSTTVWQNPRTDESLTAGKKPIALKPLTQAQKQELESAPAGVIASEGHSTDSDDANAPVTVPRDEASDAFSEAETAAGIPVETPSDKEKAEFNVPKAALVAGGAIASGAVKLVSKGKAVTDESDGEETTSKRVVKLGAFKPSQKPADAPNDNPQMETDRGIDSASYDDLIESRPKGAFCPNCGNPLIHGTNECLHCSEDEIEYAEISTPFRLLRQRLYMRLGHLMRITDRLLIMALILMGLVSLVVFAGQMLLKIPLDAIGKSDGKRVVVRPAVADTPATGVFREAYMSFSADPKAVVPCIGFEVMLEFAPGEEDELVAKLYRAKEPQGEYFYVAGGDMRNGRSYRMMRRESFACNDLVAYRLDLKQVFYRLDIYNRAGDLVKTFDPIPVPVIPAITSTDTQWTWRLPGNGPLGDVFAGMVMVEAGPPGLYSQVKKLSSPLSGEAGKDQGDGTGPQVKIDFLRSRQIAQRHGAKFELEFSIRSGSAAPRGKAPAKALYPSYDGGLKLQSLGLNQKSIEILSVEEGGQEHGFASIRRKYAAQAGATDDLKLLNQYFLPTLMGRPFTVRFRLDSSSEDQELTLPVVPEIKNFAVKTSNTGNVLQWSMPTVLQEIGFFAVTPRVAIVRDGEIIDYVSVSASSYVDSDIAENGEIHRYGLSLVDGFVAVEALVDGQVEKKMLARLNLQVSKFKEPSGTYVPPKPDASVSKAPVFEVPEGVGRAISVGILAPDVCHRGTGVGEAEILRSVITELNRDASISLYDRLDLYDVYQLFRGEGEAKAPKYLVRQPLDFLVRIRDFSHADGNGIEVWITRLSPTVESADMAFRHASWRAGRLRVQDMNSTTIASLAQRTRDEIHRLFGPNTAMALKEGTTPKTLFIKPIVPMTQKKQVKHCNRLTYGMVRRLGQVLGRNKVVSLTSPGGRNDGLFDLFQKKESVEGCLISTRTWLDGQGEEHFLFTASSTRNGRLIGLLSVKGSLMQAIVPLQAWCQSLKAPPSEKLTLSLRDQKVIALELGIGRLPRLYPLYPVDKVMTKERLAGEILREAGDERRPNKRFQADVDFARKNYGSEWDSMRIARARTVYMQDANITRLEEDVEKWHAIWQEMIKLPVDPVQFVAVGQAWEAYPVLTDADVPWCLKNAYVSLHSQELPFLFEVASLAEKPVFRGKGKNDRIQTGRQYLEDQLKWYYRTTKYQDESVPLDQFVAIDLLAGLGDPAAIKIRSELKKKTLPKTELKDLERALASNDFLCYKAYLGDHKALELLSKQKLSREFVERAACLFARGKCTDAMLWLLKHGRQVEPDWSVIRLADENWQKSIVTKKWAEAPGRSVLRLVEGLRLTDMSVPLRKFGTGDCLDASVLVTGKPIQEQPALPKPEPSQGEGDNEDN